MPLTAYIIIGVSGVGKSTISELSAKQLSLPFIEADDYHPAGNVAKMSNGIALTNEDRVPWIESLVAAINTLADRDVVIACSALTRFVRDRLRSGIAQPVQFLYLTAPAELIQQRLDQRPRHFMKRGMLGSQLATLEPPKEAVVIDASLPLEAVVDAVVRHIRPPEGETSNLRSRRP